MPTPNFDEILLKYYNNKKETLEKLISDYKTSIYLLEQSNNNAELLKQTKDLLSESQKKLKRCETRIAECINAIRAQKNIDDTRDEHDKYMTDLFIQQRQTTQTTQSTQPHEEKLSLQGFFSGRMRNYIKPVAIATAVVFAAWSLTRQK
ncbi:MAG: hypothetical protein JO131_02385 [Gammaproteobacteria bacterium]|nr:hypothetical protein [Gammaproteobacteria bacterium]